MWNINVLCVVLIGYTRAAQFTSKNHNEAINFCVCKDGCRTSLCSKLISIFHLSCKLNQMLQLKKTRHTKLTIEATIS